MPNRPKVGQILVQAGIIDQFQLNAALGEQARWGRPLGATLIKLGFVEELELVRALASQLDMPVASLDGKRIHPDVLALIPGDIAERHMVIPLFVKKEGEIEFLYVGVEDPGNLEVLDDLAFRTGKQIRPVMVGPSELWEGIDRYYRREFIETVSHVEPEDAPGPRPQASAAPASDSDQTPPVAAPVTAGTEELARHWTLPDEKSSPSIPTGPSADHPAAGPTPEPVAHAQPVDIAPVPSPAHELSPAKPAKAVGEDLTEPLIEELPEARPEPPPAEDAQVFSGEERTRIALEALTQILIEKGVMSREELHQRIRAHVQILSEQG
jgi:type IV pilus assembly protein PilB